MRRIFNREAVFSAFLPFLVVSLFIAAAAAVSLNRYWQYEVFYYDFGIFDRAIWQASRFKAPIIEHLVVGGKWIFADHFSPGIFLLSPLYWFTSRSEIILIAQSVIVGLSGLVLYQIGREVLKSRLLPLSIMMIYFLFVGLQNAVITDFHAVTMMPLPLALTLWAIVKGKIRWYFIFFLVTLMFKESTFLLGIGLGLLIILSKKEWWKIGLATILVSLGWGLVTIKLIIPYFAGGSYQYLPAPTDPLESLKAFFDQPIKRETLFFSFFSFGLLPLFYFPAWFLFLQDFATRFILGSATRWGLSLHYSAQIAVILAFSLIMVFAYLKKIKRTSRFLILIAVILVLNSIVLHQFVLHGPLGLAYNAAFYAHTKNFRFLEELIARVPEGASVMTQNNLAVRFTHQRVWLLRSNYHDYQPDYILIDARKGQNPNNFFGTGDLVTIITQLKNDPEYSIDFQTEEQYLFERAK